MVMLVDRPILGAGATARNMRLTSADLDVLVDNFNVPVPIVALDDSDRQIGSVLGVRRVGNRIVADLEFESKYDVPGLSFSAEIFLPNKSLLRLALLPPPYGVKQGTEDEDATGFECDAPVIVEGGQ